MSIIREVLCCSNVGYSWYSYTDDTGTIINCGFTVFAGSGLDFDHCTEVDIILKQYEPGMIEWCLPTHVAVELANDAFVEHHAWEVELEAMHRPLILTMEDEGALRFNPLTILRAS